MRERKEKREKRREREGGGYGISLNRIKDEGYREEYYGNEDRCIGVATQHDLIHSETHRLIAHLILDIQQLY